MLRCGMSSANRVTCLQAPLHIVQTSKRPMDALNTPPVTGPLSSTAKMDTVVGNGNGIFHPQSRHDDISSGDSDSEKNYSTQLSSTFTYSIIPSSSHFITIAAVATSSRMPCDALQRPACCPDLVGLSSLTF